VIFRFITLCLVWLALGSALTFASTPPWAPDSPCKLNPARPQGLHPEAYSALKAEQVAHRVTQGINHSPDRGNVHDTDGTIKGSAYTGAVDISVRCLSPAQIRDLLGRLANAGFAAWYRKQDQDGWSGPPHIHAVWSGCRLKPVLQWQVESWLSGKNGLGSEQPYRFWQPSADMKTTVNALYRKFN
jgi:hypothetical protein